MFKIKGYEGPTLECDKCGSEMQLKNGRFGKYFGCMNESCKNTRKLLRNGEAVLSRGLGDGTVDLRPLEVGRNPFKVNDVVLTSGTGGLYPPRVAIARVVRLDDDGAIALPMASPAQNSLALVRRPYEPAALSDFDTPLDDTDETSVPDVAQ